MTNGEKMQEMFPEGKTRRCRGGVVFESDGWCHAYDSDWWNTEYKGPVIYDDTLPPMPYATPDNCGNYIEQTTINDLGVNYTINSLDDFIEFGKKAFGVELTIKALEQEPVLDKIRAEIKEWYWQADKQAIAKDPCVVDAMIDLFIRTIDKYKAESEDKE